MEKIITYFGQPAKVNCDENCSKAWGINNRPRIYPEIGERVYGLNDESVYPDQDNIDENNYIYLADHELPVAPIDPGTMEDSDRKPINEEQKGNKWCIRECERCNMSEPGEWKMALQIINFTNRKPNYPDEFKTNP